MNFNWLITTDTKTAKQFIAALLLLSLTSVLMHQTSVDLLLPMMSLLHVVGYGWN